MSEKKINVLGKWVGDIYGTHHCHVLAEFTLTDGNTFLEVRAQSTPAITAIFRGPVASPDFVEAKETEVTLSELINGSLSGLQVTINIQATNQDVLQGAWETTNGAKGVVQLSRWKFTPNNKQPEHQEPTEIIAREYKFGNLRIYKNDVYEIIKIMQLLVAPDGVIFVTEEHDGVKRTSLAQAYLNKERKPNDLTSLVIAAQKNMNGFTSSLVLNLIRNGVSTLSVQSPDVLWFYSTPMAVKELLDKKSDKIIELYRKYGLNFNALLFLALLIWLPDAAKDRAIFVVSFLAFVLLHACVHKRAALSLINPEKERPSGFKEKHPTISYILLTLASAFLAAGAKIILEHWGNIFSALHIGSA